MSKFESKQKRSQNEQLREELRQLPLPFKSDLISTETRLKQEQYFRNI